MSCYALATYRYVPVGRQAGAKGRTLALRPCIRRLMSNEYSPGAATRWSLSFPRKGALSSSKVVHVLDPDWKNMKDFALFENSELIIFRYGRPRLAGWHAPQLTTRNALKGLTSVPSSR
jgi:hypothetical protein